MKTFSMRAIGTSVVAAMLWQGPAIADPCDDKLDACLDQCEKEAGSPLNPIWWLFGGSHAYDECMSLCRYNYRICYGHSPADANKGRPLGQTSAAPSMQVVPGVIDLTAPAM